MSLPPDALGPTGGRAGGEGGGNGDGGGRERWLQRGAPIAAALILVVGVGFLVFRGSGSGSGSGSDGVATVATDRGSVRTVVGPEDPVIVTTIPLSDTTGPVPTAPPLRETTTTSDASVTASTDVSGTSGTTTPDTAGGTPTTTVAAVDGGPNQAQIDAALLRVTDLDGAWTTETPDFQDPCGDNPAADAAVFEGLVVFEQPSEDAAGVRQISNVIHSFPDAATAESAFTADVALVEGCTATTVVLDGVSYRAEVRSSPFDDEAAASFACSEQNAFITSQFTNSAAEIPYIGQTTFSFRCGRNIGAVSITTTVGLEDMSNDNFFSSGATSNSRVATLVGSS